ncbi:MAG: glycine--tRNA ligase subunit beta [Pseudomonadota bacterium]|nr:glycine--tRNA ligase subunit beta [Pseudomonadota bacterium]
MSETETFLFELGTEELPAMSLLSLRNNLINNIESGLKKDGITHGVIKGFATPRRLGVLIKDLSLNQLPTHIALRGPPIAKAFKDGEPTKAADSFAKKCGVAINQLDREKTSKGEWLFFSSEKDGQATIELLPTILDGALKRLPLKKKMRWEENNFEFTRPVRWVVMLLGKEIIDAEFFGLKTNRNTRGHRFHASENLKIGTAGEYEDLLLNKGKVIADFEARQEKIIEIAKKAAGSSVALINAKTAEEITGLVEWPVAVKGFFPKEFLALPDEVLIATLENHQKYFPITQNKKLQNNFIAISNLESDLPDEVKNGNERVILPRLADASFFWGQDTQRAFADRKEELDQVIYQKDLGSLLEKSVRVGKLMEILAMALGENLEISRRAAELAKIDLLTKMVGEFPDLQGLMGYYYCLHDGEDDRVAVAVSEQYLPRFAEDKLPETSIGNALSVSDKLDTLAGNFLLGKKPTGKKDPYGLRRQALGLVRICVINKIDFNLKELITAAIKQQPVKEINPDLERELYNFILDRAQAWYVNHNEGGYISHDIFMAVRSQSPGSLVDFDQRLHALLKFSSLEAAKSLAAANKRISNILKACDRPTDIPEIVSTTFFSTEEESALNDAVNELIKEHKINLKERNYLKALQCLSRLETPIDNFFNSVMIMTDDAKKKNNRLAQLKRVNQLFLDIADISKLPIAS